MSAALCLIFQFIAFGFHTTSGIEEIYIDNVGRHQGSLEMVPVSSTVIPVTSLFGTSKLESTGVGTVQAYPFFRPVGYSRRSNFFDKSTKPDTRVRLITTRSNKVGLLEANDG